MFLEEDKQDNRGEAGDEEGGQDDRLGGGTDELETIELHHDGISIFVIENNQRPEERVPGSHEREDGQDRDNRFAQRHNDLPEDAPIPGAVNPPGVNQVIRNPVEESFEQENRKGIYSGRQVNRPVGS